MIYKKILTLSLCIAVGFTVACESDENNQIAQAESCINESSGNASAIASCSSYLEGLDSPRAKTLKCSILLSSAGLSNIRIVSAVEVMDDDSAANKELQFMALIALNNTPSADSIPTTCSGTDSPGIEFIANAARMGTVLADVAGIDITTIDEDTTFSSAELTGPGGIVLSCEADPACLITVGESASSMFSTFCSDVDLTENEVCADVSSAIAGGGNAQTIGQALIDLLE